MSKKNTLQILITLFLILLVQSISFSEVQKSYTQKVKVIVTFDGDIQPHIVEKYGQVLNTLKIINGVVAVIDRADISLLQKEKAIKDVVIDSRIDSIRPEKRQPREYLTTHLQVSDANAVIVGWNLQEPGIAAANTPPDGNSPDYYGAWSTYSVDGTGVVIAILDTGVNYTLTDLDGPQYFLVS